MSPYDPAASSDAPRAGGETPEMRIDALLHDFQQACEEAAGFAEFSSQPAKDAAMLRAILRNELRASFLARHRDGERYRWIRDNAECGLTDKADEGSNALWSFWAPFTKSGEDWMGASIDTAMRPSPERARHGVSDTNSLD